MDRYMILVIVLAALASFCMMLYMTSALKLELDFGECTNMTQENVTFEICAPAETICAEINSTTCSALMNKSYDSAWDECNDSWNSWWDECETVASVKDTVNTTLQDVQNLLNRTYMTFSGDFISKCISWNSTANSQRDTIAALEDNLDDLSGYSGKLDNLEALFTQCDADRTSCQSNKATITGEYTMLKDQFFVGFVITAIVVGFVCWYLWKHKATPSAAGGDETLEPGEEGMA